MSRGVPPPPTQHLSVQEHHLRKGPHQVTSSTSGSNIRFLDPGPRRPGRDVKSLRAERQLKLRLIPQTFLSYSPGQGITNLILCLPSIFHVSQIESPQPETLVTFWNWRDCECRLFRHPSLLLCTVCLYNTAAVLEIRTFCCQPKRQSLHLCTIKWSYSRHSMVWNQWRKDG